MLPWAAAAGPRIRTAAKFLPPDRIGY